MNAPMQPVIYHVDQKSPEWLALRANTLITGSMVGAVLGLSPYSTRADALRDKVRELCGAPREFTGNVATQWGEANEDKARQEYAAQKHYDVTEVGFVIHPVYDWIGASPDGLINGQGLVEIKCPYSQKLTSIADQPHYMAQIQLQLHVCKRIWCDFVCWTPTGFTIERVMMDPKWMEQHLPALQAFRDDVLAIVADPELAAPHLEPLEIQRDDPDFEALEAKYLAILEQEKRLKDAKDALREQLIAEAHDKKCRGKHLLVFPTQKAGSIAYAKACKDLLGDTDLSKYQSQPSISWTIKTL